MPSELSIGPSRLPDPSVLLERHRRVHGRLRGLAAERLDRGRHEEAAVYIQAVAEHAWMSHPGTFADHELEGLVDRLARALNLPPAAPSDVTPNPQNVLHVVTGAHDVGGHTRLCFRWIETDSDRRHSVVLTQQGDFPVPEALTGAVAASGGVVLDLSASADSLVERAMRLRELAGEYEAVVLHVHPYEVVSAIAFALRGPTPVVFVNHADHVFWLGVHSADLFVHIRERGVSLAAARRGVPRERSAVLPIPIPRARALRESRAQTRRELGIGPDETMVLTVGTPYKYESPDGIGFLARVVPALAGLPRVKLVAVGPGDEGPWATARETTQGRVLALGMRRDVPSLLVAADVYIDSFPLGSGTALLEAGAAGLPVCRLAQAGQWHATFELGDPLLDPHLIDAHDERTLRQALSALANDPDRRAELGARTRDAVMAGHVGEAWLQQLRDVYAQAAAMAHEPRLTARRPQQAADDVMDVNLSGIQAKNDAYAAFLQSLPSRCRALPRRAAVRMGFAFVIALREDVRQIRPERFVRAAARSLTRR